MMDELEALEKRIAEVYWEAVTDFDKKIAEAMEAYDRERGQMLKKLEAGKITEDDFQDFLDRHLTLIGQYDDMRDELARQLVEADKVAAGMINDAKPALMAEGMNYGAWQLSGAGFNMFALYDADTARLLLTGNPKLLPDKKVDIPKDMRWNSQKLNAALMQGILQGESVPAIAQRLMSVSTMGEAAAIRNARTMGTAAQNIGRMNSYRRAREMGIRVKKQWLATTDKRTRDSHAALDGEVRGIDEKFSNGLMEPGDPDGDPSEVYNCRCTLIADIDGDDPFMSYDEWRDGFGQG